MKEKNKGITLIALVITIIILLILAGVTLSIVFNGGIIDKSQNAIDKYNTSSKNEEEKLDDLESKFQQLYSEMITAKSPQPEWIIDVDYGTPGLSLGDLVKPNLPSTNYLSNERFYVIDENSNDGTLLLLAEKNIKTDDTTTPSNNIQNPSSGAKNSVIFSSNTQVYKNSSIKSLAEEYANKLSNAGLTLQDVEIEEGEAAAPGIKGRLMWGSTSNTSEVQKALAINATGTNSITGATIVYGPEGDRLNYFLGSLSTIRYDIVWSVYGSIPEVRESSMSYSGLFGVRPVIKILRTKI